MTRAYKHPNGRVTLRAGNGRFRPTTLQDFGIAKDEINRGSMICANCGYGRDEYWHPILKTGICPKCGSREKVTA